MQMTAGKPPTSCISVTAPLHPGLIILVGASGIPMDTCTLTRAAPTKSMLGNTARSATFVAHASEHACWQCITCCTLFIVVVCYLLQETRVHARSPGRPARLQVLLPCCCVLFVAGDSRACTLPWAP